MRTAMGKTYVCASEDSSYKHSWTRTGNGVSMVLRDNRGNHGYSKSSQCGRLE